MSWNQTLFKYQFDKTAVSELNLVGFEEISFTTNSIIPFPVKEGMFYTKGVILKDKATGRILDDSEYNFIAIDPYLTARTGKEVAGAIELVDNNFIGKLSLTYQCVGGAEGMSNSLVRKLIDAIEGAANGGDWSWELITGKPSLFPPSSHTHPLSTISDLGTLKQSLEDVANALIMRIPLGDSPLNFQEQIDRVVKLQAQMQNMINRIALQSGTAEDLTAVQNLIENDHKIHDEYISVVAGTEKTISEWGVSAGISAKGSVIFTDGTDVETLDFNIVWSAKKSPKIVAFGNVRTGNKLLTVSVVKINNAIRLQVTPSLTGTVKLKWSELV